MNEEKKKRSEGYAKFAEEFKKNSKEYTSHFREMTEALTKLRGGNDSHKPVDISLEEYVNEKWNISKEELLELSGISSKVSTMQNVFSMPDQSVKWLVPEIIRDAIVLGVREAPFYPQLITSDQPVTSLNIVMPSINMSDATPAKVNEAETIPMGNVSFGQKSVTLFKIGKGFSLTDEVTNYVSLDVLAIYLRDFGIQLGYALDSLAIDTLINGNMPGGEESAPSIGVTTVNSIVYRDLLRIWIRAARMGRNFTNIIGSEDSALDLLDLPEFKQRYAGTTYATLNVKSPVPTSANMYIHPGIPTGDLMLIDQAAAMIKLTAKPLMLENERIVSNQTSASYASLTTGFCKMYRDATVLLNKALSFSANGFPSYMDIDPYLLNVLQ